MKRSPGEHEDEVTPSHDAQPAYPGARGVGRRTLLAAGGAVVGGIIAGVAGCGAEAARPPASGPSSAPPGNQPTGSAGSGATRIPKPTTSAPRSTASTPSSTPSSARTESATNAQIAARATVPVLCWHQLRNWTSADGSYARNLLICPPAKFRAQLDALADHGWTSIGPEEYLAHLTTGEPLPAKPVMLTFDDSQGSQISEGLPQLRARKMTATFFAMTVVLDKPDWFSRRDLKRLDDAGMTVAAHTWDHHRVDEYAAKDWSVQLKQPRELLEKIIGKPVEHFAYPYGAWDAAALPHVRAAGYASAYQLADRKPSPSAPLCTLRRDLVVSTWSGQQLLQHLAAQKAKR